MQYRLRTLLLLALIAPPLLAVGWSAASRYVERQRYLELQRQFLMMRQPPVVLPIMANPDVYTVPTVPPNLSYWEFNDWKQRGGTPK